ncbi:MAG: SpoIIE family protein phosphatase [Verrucomicrobiales bacterium]|nr:SpoIIE family protein phosphatase [Verrucomicrobiales bacterium]
MHEQPIRILLVEGVSAFAQQLEEMLRGSKGVGFEVIQTDSWHDGLRLLARGGIDIVLLDLSLLEGSWLESFEQIRLEAQHVPVIVLSTLDDETVAVRAVHEGAQDYLVKSELDRAVLVRSIRYGLERKRSEMALLQAEEKYRSIFEHITEGIFQTTPDGHYISANPALAAIYGYSSPEELIRGLTNIGDQLYVDPRRRPEFIRLMEEHDVVSGFESKIRRKDSSVIWISENVRAVRDAKNQLLYYEGTVEDITERKRAEEELRNSETLYHSLVETLPQNIFRKDLNERFTFANQRFCQTLGKPLSEILGKTDFDFFPPELAAKYQQDDRVIIETGKMMETIEENQPPGGEKLFVNVVKTPLYDSQGNIIGLQGIFWDITERRRAEERLRKTTMELAKNRQELQAKNEQLQEDLRMAREIQQAIIPQQYPSFPRSADPSESSLRFCHRYLPTGAVGGDFFSVVPLSDTKAGVFICDVMGHGVRSALVTAIVRTLVEELTPLAANPGQLLAQINHDLRTILKQSGSIMFTTAFYAVVDLETHRLYYANAGHPKPLLVHRSNGEVESLRSASNAGSPALGLFDTSTYKTAECALQAGDLLMLFTDGLYDVEGPNQDSYNLDWLSGEVRRRASLSTSLLFDQLLHELKVASVGGQLADDVCLVGVEVVK